MTLIGKPGQAVNRDSPKSTPSQTSSPTASNGYKWPTVGELLSRTAANVARDEAVYRSGHSGSTSTPPSQSPYTGITGQQVAGRQALQEGKTDELFGSSLGVQAGRRLLPPESQGGGGVIRNLPGHSLSRSELPYGGRSQVYGKTEQERDIREGTVRIFKDVERRNKSNALTEYDTESEYNPSELYIGSGKLVQKVGEGVVPDLAVSEGLQPIQKAEGVLAVEHQFNLNEKEWNSLSRLDKFLLSSTEKGAPFEYLRTGSKSDIAVSGLLTGGLIGLTIASGGATASVPLFVRTLGVEIAKFTAAGAVGNVAGKVIEEKTGSPTAGFIGGMGGSILAYGGLSMSQKYLVNRLTTPKIVGEVDIIGKVNDVESISGKLKVGSGKGVLIPSEKGVMGTGVGNKMPEFSRSKFTYTDLFTHKEVELRNYVFKSSGNVKVSASELKSDSSTTKNVQTSGTLFKISREYGAAEVGKPLPKLTNSVSAEGSISQSKTKFLGKVFEGKPKVNAGVFKNVDYTIIGSQNEGYVKGVQASSSRRLESILTPTGSKTGNVGPKTNVLTKFELVKSVESTPKNTFIGSGSQKGVLEFKMKDINSGLAQDVILASKNSGLKSTIGGFTLSGFKSDARLNQNMNTLINPISNVKEKYVGVKDIISPRVDVTLRQRTYPMQQFKTSTLLSTPQKKNIINDAITRPKQGISTYSSQVVLSTPKTSSKSINDVMSGSKSINPSIESKGFTTSLGFGRWGSRNPLFVPRVGTPPAWPGFGGSKGLGRKGLGWKRKNPWGELDLGFGTTKRTTKRRRRRR